jgi:hypothetical protein
MQMKKTGLSVKLLKKLPLDRLFKGVILKIHFLRFNKVDDSGKSRAYIFCIYSSFFQACKDLFFTAFFPANS